MTRTPSPAITPEDFGIPRKDGYYLSELAGYLEVSVRTLQRLRVLGEIIATKRKAGWWVPRAGVGAILRESNQRGVFGEDPRLRAALAGGGGGGATPPLPFPTCPPRLAVLLGWLARVQTRENANESRIAPPPITVAAVGTVSVDTK
jgi:hypothetical protein